MSVVFPLTSIVEPLDVAAMFPEAQPLDVELGCGDGSFLLEYARRHPELNLLGVERLLGRLRKVERKGTRAGFRNLRGVRIEAAYCVQYLLPPRSVHAFHVYFPDPWPKRRHWRRRLVNEVFPELAHRALVPEGTVYLRTDDLAYFTQMQEVFAQHAGFRPIPTPTDLAELWTDFEREFQAKGVASRRSAYRKVSAATG